MKAYRIPTPTLVYCDVQRGIAYAWSCNHKGLGLRTLGDTRQEAIDDFKQAVIDEYPGEYRDPE